MITSAVPTQPRISILAPFRCLQHSEERFPLFDEIRGELRRVAAADVLHYMDRSGRDEQEVAVLECHRRLALHLILQRAFEDVDDFFARMRVHGRDPRGSKSTRTMVFAPAAMASSTILFTRSTFDLLMRGPISL